MKFIPFGDTFHLLTQESHLAKASLLHGFDTTIKTNFLQEKDGLIYSALFSLSIGIERLLKLTLITSHMISNNYTPPSISDLKKFGHNISELYDECIKLPLQTHKSKKLTKADQELLNFISRFGVSTRYYNLNELCHNKNEQHPINEWKSILTKIYEHHTSYRMIEKTKTELMQRMDRSGPSNSLTFYASEHGLMTVFDILFLQTITPRASRLAVWRIIEILRPFYHLLQTMNEASAKIETPKNTKETIIPYYEEFFLFLLAQKHEVMRRKNWQKAYIG